MIPMAVAGISLLSPVVRLISQNLSQNENVQGTRGFESFLEGQVSSTNKTNGLIIPPTGRIGGAELHQMAPGELKQFSIGLIGANIQARDLSGKLLVGKVETIRSYPEGLVLEVEGREVFIKGLKELSWEHNRTF